MVIAGSLRSAKLVRKPWGHERWLVPETSSFAFKRIRLKAGMRTSLQLHRQKEEAALILSGKGTLVWRRDREGPMQSVSLMAGAVVHVLPNTVHRIVAETDLTLIEVSTPELDDVIRIADDSGRPDGKIESEHA